MGVSVDTGGKGGKRPLDAELNLVPFIDLLVCCICFLLITAVWTKMSRIDVTPSRYSSASHKDPDQEPEPMKVKVTLLVGEDGYTMTVGADRVVIPKQGSVYDTERLAQELQQIKRQYPKKEDVTVAVEDGVRYMHAVDAMDIALQEEFRQIRVTDASQRI